VESWDSGQSDHVETLAGLIFLLQRTPEPVGSFKVCGSVDFVVVVLRVVEAVEVEIAPVLFPGFQRVRKALASLQKARPGPLAAEESSRIQWWRSSSCRRAVPVDDDLRRRPSISFGGSSGISMCVRRWSRSLAART
jgi:hypothetical protein